MGAEAPRVKPASSLTVESGPPTDTSTRKLTDAEAEMLHVAQRRLEQRRIELGLASSPEATRKPPCRLWRRLLGGFAFSCHFRARLRAVTRMGP